MTKIMIKESYQCCICLFFLLLGGQYGDDVIRTWSLKKGKLVKEYENLPRDPEKVYFVDKDKKILIHYRSSVVVINISDNKQFTQEISHMCQLCVCGPNRSIFGTFLIRDCNFYSVIDGTVKNKLTFDGNKNLFDIRSIISGKYISYMYY